MKDLYQQHGASGWFELMTTDVEGAKKFYNRFFGWEPEDMPMED
jgi:predicted enzyme related to lactoylglutathione lyase